MRSTPFENNCIDSLISRIEQICNTSILMETNQTDQENPCGEINYILQSTIRELLIKLFASKWCWFLKISFSFVTPIKLKFTPKHFCSQIHQNHFSSIYFLYFQTRMTFKTEMNLWKYLIQSEYFSSWVMSYPNVSPFMD